MTAADAGRSQQRSEYRAVALECAQRIGGTGRLEPAGVAKPGAENQPIAPDETHQRARRFAAHEAEERAAARNNASSSAFAADFKASEAALGNDALSNGARSRTTHMPASSEEANRSPAA